MCHFVKITTQSQTSSALLMIHHVYEVGRCYDDISI